MSEMASRLCELAKAKISFTVFGLPQSAGSKRAFPIRRAGGQMGVAVTDANPKSRDWKNAVTSCALEAYKGPLLRGPLSVEIVFYLPRPKGHYGSGKNAATMKKSAPTFITTKPDVLKLARAVEDSMTSSIYMDDSQTVRLNVRKFYGVPARCEVTVWEIDG